MQAVLTSLIAVAGTLFGAGLTWRLQQATLRRTTQEARAEKRREELTEAVLAFASTMTLLRRAEHDRALKRLRGAEGQLREDARQETYRLRTEARGAYYRVRLLADPGVDTSLLEDSEALMEIVRQPQDMGNKDALEQASSRTAEAIGAVIDMANKRLRTEAFAG